MTDQPTANPSTPPEGVDEPAMSSAPSGYAAAVRELDGLLADLEDDTLDIDLLATKVERASELVQFCRARITAARVHVDQIVANLDQLAMDGTEHDSGT